MDIRNLTVPSPSTADPELSERVVHHRFSAQEKLRVLAAIGAAAGQAGGIGAIQWRWSSRDTVLLPPQHPSTVRRYGNL
jgi:hypothetical protein